MQWVCREGVYSGSVQWCVQRVCAVGVCRGCVQGCVQRMRIEDVCSGCVQWACPVGVSTLTEAFPR